VPKNSAARITRGEKSKTRGLGTEARRTISGGPADEVSKKVTPFCFASRQEGSPKHLVTKPGVRLQWLKGKNLLLRGGVPLYSVKGAVLVAVSWGEADINARVGKFEKKVWRSRSRRRWGKNAHRQEKKESRKKPDGTLSGSTRASLWKKKKVKLFPYKKGNRRGSFSCATGEKGCGKKRRKGGRSKA